MRGDNRRKRAARLRESAERMATRGLLDHVAECDLFAIQMYSGADLQQLEHDDHELACTERVLLCLFGALMAADAA